MKLTEWLAEDDKLKGAEIFTALLTLAAGIVWVYLDGFTGETIAQVTATLGTASVIIITFVDKMKRQEVTDFVTAGSKALAKLQNEHPAILSGPKYSKRNKEDFAIEEATTDERKYLFFQKEGKGQEAQFIPVIPFKQAIVAVFLGSWGLRVATGRTGTLTEQEIEDTKVAVQNAVKTLVEREFRGLYEEIAFDPKKSGNGNMCIALDFYDDKISKKQFESAVYQIGKTTLEAITTASKRGNNG
jgi:hypothetical protein